MKINGEFTKRADKRKFNYHIEQAGIKYPGREGKEYYRTADAIDKVLRYGMEWGLRTEQIFCW